MRPKPKALSRSSPKTISPESYFIRTGRITKGLDPKRAKRIGTRFLSKKWFDVASNGKAKQGKVRLPLPTFNQRIRGGRLRKADLPEIETQAGFAASIFARHVPQGRKPEILKELEKMLTRRMLSINLILGEHTRSKNLAEMRNSGKEFFTYLRDFGEAYPALIRETNGKVYFAKGWSNDGNKEELTAPLHEALHIFQRMGVIKTAVPFAQAADRLYGFELGIFKPNKRLKMPTEEEFGRKPPIEKKFDRKFPNYESEPYWAYIVGDRIGLWAYLNLPAGKRWDYLYLRCMGKSHAEAINGL